MKTCANCGGEGSVEHLWCVVGYEVFSVKCTCCGMKTPDCKEKSHAEDIWDCRVENSDEADKWYSEAVSQRDKANKAELERDELSEALSQARRMLAYAGKLQ